MKKRLPELETLVRKQDAFPCEDRFYRFYEKRERRYSRQGGGRKAAGLNHEQNHH